jgi:hypothetical protein
MKEAMMVRIALLAAVLVTLVASPASAVITHQYTFNDGTANDAVGGAHGTLVNGAGVAAGQLVLSNPFNTQSSAGKYLSLPTTILPASGSVTIQQWFNFTNSNFWSAAWTFSDHANDTNPPDADSGQYFAHTISNPQPGTPPGGANTGGSSVVQTLAGYGGGAETRAYETTPGLGADGGGYLDNGQTYMATTVLDGVAGTLSYYVHRVSDGAGGLQQTIPAISLSSYAFTNAYLGRSAFGNDPAAVGLVDEFRVYNEARTATQIQGDLTTGPEGGGGPKLVVNRTTGAVTLSSGTTTPIFKYTLGSASGTLDPASVQPITQRLDATYNGGNGTFDDDDAWEVLSNTAALIEEQDAIGEGADDGGSLGTVALSASGGWLKSFREDVTASIQVFDGANFSTINIPVEFTGNGGAAFKRGDFNFDNLINDADWNQFRQNHLAVIAPATTDAASYALGDLDGDQDNDFADFRLFQADYDLANGSGAFAALASIPEPGSALLFSVAIGAALTFNRRQLAR